MGQTVNLLVFTFGGSNPSSPTSSLKFFCYVLKSFLSLFLRDFKAGESGGRELPFGNDRPTVRCPTQKSPKRLLKFIFEGFQGGRERRKGVTFR